MSVVTPMFSDRDVRLSRLEAKVDVAWERLRRARKRRELAGEHLSSKHYLAVVDNEQWVLAAVDAWQNARRGQK